MCGFKRRSAEKFELNSSAGKTEGDGDEESDTIILQLGLKWPVPPSEFSRVHRSHFVVHLIVSLVAEAFPTKFRTRDDDDQSRSHHTKQDIHFTQISSFGVHLSCQSEHWQLD